MSSTPSRSARAFSSTSRAALGGAALLAALVATSALAATDAPAASPASDVPPLAALRVVEFETALAKGKGIYLVLDPGARRLTVKSRGLALESVDVAELSLLEFRPLLFKGDAPELVAPTVWKITEGPGDTDRETIAPPELRPYSEEEEEEPAPAPAAAGTTPPAKKKPEEMEKPSSYRVSLDNGWQLFITPQPPRGSFFRRLAAAVKDGWLRIRGTAPEHPPLVALVMPAPSAQRLHHLFRTGTEILVLP
jgi:hypothetical protein